VQLKWKEAEANFREELGRVEDKALPSPVEKTDQVEDRIAAAHLPAAYIVQQAWIRLERAAEDARRELTPPERGDGQHPGRDLAAQQPPPPG
jgi:hypothetical protein